MRGLYGLFMGLLGTASLAAFVPVSQTPKAIIEVMDRGGRSIVQLIDGNEIRLRISLPGPSAEERVVFFILMPGEQAIGNCTIPAGESACSTELFPSLGWYWGGEDAAPGTRSVHALDANQNILGQSAELSLRPRPVVMVHGFVSAWDTWTPYLGEDGFLASIGLQGFAVGDGQVPGQLNTGRLSDPAGRTNTIQQNAEVLGQYIEGVKQRTGAEMVDLLVHSMGGMISRYYIDRVMQERDVAQLIMLGSPMGGSDCSVLPASLGFYLPASLEIRSSYMLGIFNQQITHRRGIHFYDLAGTAILEAYQSPCTGVPNDTVVSMGSINAIPLKSSQIKAIHSELTLSRDAFEQFVRPLLENPAGEFSPAADAGQSQAAAPALEFTRIYRGHVEQNGSTDISINIESNISVASFALYDPTRSVNVSVRGASGNVIELDPQANGFIRIEDPAAMFYLGYGFSNPKPGPWKVTVLGTPATPAAGADFSISVYFVGGAELQAASSTLIPRPQEPVTFTARLSLGGQPLEITEGKVLIRGPEGAVETVELQPGLQASAEWRPELSGIYGVDIVVTGAGPDHSTVERTAFLTIEAQADPGQEEIRANLLALGGGALLLAGLTIFLVSRVVRSLTRRAR